MGTEQDVVNMLTPSSGPPQSASTKREDSCVALIFRRNSLFREILPAVVARLQQQLSVSVRQLEFPETTTPAAMGAEIRAFASELPPGALYLTDVSARRGMRTLGDEPNTIHDTAKQGVLLDLCLSDAVHKLVIQELRNPNIRILNSTDPTLDLPKKAELMLRAERLFFAALLTPIVAQHPQYEFVVAAPRLFAHVPFLPYMTMLQGAYIQRFGLSDPVITPKLLAPGNDPRSILGAARIPESVLSRLARIACGPIMHPCDWIADILRDIGGRGGVRVRVVDTVWQLAPEVQDEEHHLRVVIGDRHVLEPLRLEEDLRQEGASPAEATRRAALCLAVPRFRLPLDVLLWDLAEAGLLMGTSLSDPRQVSALLADAVVRRIADALGAHPPPAAGGALPSQTA